MQGNQTMERTLRTRSRLAVAAVLFFGQAAWAADLTGTWSGVLDAAGQEMTVVFNLKNAEGSYSATMDVPSQGAKGIAVDTVDVNDREITFAIDSLGVGYSGQLAEDEQSIEGTFRQAGLEIPLRLERGEPGEEEKASPTRRRPQTPKPPFPYRSEEVRYENPRAEGVTLAGTLLIPEGEGPFPAVVFITGSGPTDRDETLAGHKVFLVIADYLSRRAIATLRFDDRGTAESTGDYAAATTFDFAEDAVAGVEYLKTRPRIDPSQIGLIGHSEGGLIAPIARTKSDDVAFMVLLAGPAIPGEQLILKQMEDILRQQGVAKGHDRPERRGGQATLCNHESRTERRQGGRADARGPGSPSGSATRKFGYSRQSPSSGAGTTSGGAPSSPTTRFQTLAEP